MFVLDSHDAVIPGTSPTPWLFYSGVDGEPGRYFKVVSLYGSHRRHDADGNLWWTPSGREEAYPVSHEFKDVWHESFGLDVPKELKSFNPVEAADLSPESLAKSMKGEKI